MSEEFGEQEKTKIPWWSVSLKGAVNFVVFFGLLIITIHEAYSCFERFLSYPKYTSFRLVNQNEVEFPSLTFCPVVTESLKEEVLKVTHF